MKSDPVDLQQFVGKRVTRGDTTIRVVHVSDKSVGYEISPMRAVFYKTHSAFRAWLAGAVEVEGEA